MRSVILVFFNDVTIKIIDTLKLNFCRVLWFDWSRACNRGTSSIDMSIFFKRFREKKSQSDAIFSSSTHCHDILQRGRNEFDDCRSCLQILCKSEGNNTSFRTNDCLVVSSDLQYQSVAPQCTSVYIYDAVTLQTYHLEDADSRTTNCVSGFSCAPTCLRFFYLYRQSLISRHDNL